MKTINWENVRSASQMDMANRTLKVRENQAHAARYVATEGFAWPGGYPLVLITTDGGILCPKCVREEYENIYSSTIGDYRDGWSSECLAVVGQDLDPDDGSMYCDHCSCDISKL